MRTYRSTAQRGTSWNEARSVHVGLNSVDAAVYENWLPVLTSAEADARAMRGLADSMGFASRLLVGAEATRENVVDCLAATIERLVAGDVLSITYAGHMTSMSGVGDDPDGWDEAWCLYDGILLDDEFHDLLADVPEGVDVLVVTDSCFAGGVVDEESVDLPPGAAALLGQGGVPVSRPPPLPAGSPAIGAGGLHPKLVPMIGLEEGARARAPQPRLGDLEIQRLVLSGHIPRGKARPASKRPSIAARVVALAAATEGTLAFEGSEHGFFTAALVDAVRSFEGRPTSYQDLMATVAALVPIQRPSMGVFGAASAEVAAAPAFGARSARPGAREETSRLAFGLTRANP